MDERMVIELANGASLKEAAKLAGFSERTAQRRWADSEFRQRILEARCQMRWQAVSKLATNMNAAAEALNAALGSKSDSVRVAAARSILRIANDFSGQAEENLKLINTLERVEEQFKQVNQECDEE
jgi:hypothetical protein